MHKYSTRKPGQEPQKNSGQPRRPYQPEKTDQISAPGNKSSANWRNTTRTSHNPSGQPPRVPSGQATRPQTGRPQGPARTTSAPARTNQPSETGTNRPHRKPDTHRPASGRKESFRKPFARKDVLGKPFSRTGARAIPRPAEEKHAKDTLRFMALGGLEEIGRNMSVFEYGDDILLVDAGVQFPDAETPGIDYIIPNIEYLQNKTNKIKGFIVTHAHLDHIGSIPYLIEKLGNPTIYTTKLTSEIIKRRQEDFPNLPKLDFEIVSNHDKVKLSDNFEVEFFGIIHTIPDTVSLVIKTPVGNFVYCTDVKFDYDEKNQPLGLNEFEWAGKQKIHTLFLESTNAPVQGISVSEKTVEKNIDDIFKKAKGRLIIGTFSSMLTRLGEIIKIAETYDRKVFISGFSMKTNLQIAQNLGYLKVKKGLIVPMEEIHKYKDDKILVLSTGAQGESNASLMKIVNGEHRFIQIKAGDTVIFSSSVIPGNEKDVQILKDNLARQGAKVYHSQIVDLHASGHATGEELQKIIELINPKYSLPIHGHFFMRATHSELAQEVGIPKENVLLPDSGQVVEFTKTGAKVTEETIPSYYVMVDGLGVGDVGEIVMRDRKVLAQEGMVVVIATLDRRTGRFLKNPDIISRGFIYLRENKELVEELRNKITGIVSKMPRFQEMEPDYLKGLIRDQIGQFLYNRTKRRPMVLPVVIQV